MLFAAAALLAPSVWADTYWAAPDGTEDAACTEAEPGTIAAAIAKCVARESFAEGDVVMLKKGVYGDGTTASMITLNKAYMTLRSEDNDPSSVLLVGAGDNALVSCLDASALATVSGVTMTNYVAALLLNNAQNLYLDNCVLVSNKVRLANNPRSVTRCVIRENMRVPDSRTPQFYYNSTDGEFVVRDTIFTNNIISSTGCIDIRDRSVKLLVEKCTFIDNYMDHSSANDPAHGGVAAYGYRAGGMPTNAWFVACRFSNNRGKNHGNVRMVQVRDSIIENTQQHYSAARESILVNCVVSNCISRYMLSGSTLTNCTIVDCLGPSNEEVECLFQNCTFSGCTIAGNVNQRTAWGQGRLFDTCTLDGCTVTNNYAWPIFNGGLVRNSLIVDNRVNPAVSGVGCSENRSLLRGGAFLNCTFTGNSLNKAFLATVAGSVTNGCTNCIFYANTSVAPGTVSESGAGEVTTGFYSHCLYSSIGTATLQSVEACAMTAEAPFYGSAKPETPYLPKRKSGAVEAGILLSDIGPLDYYGAKRLAGRALDIGCAEYPLLNGTTILLR